MMNYVEFLDASARSDKSANDAAHFFSKVFSTPIAYILYRLGMTPNMITWFFFVIGFCASVSFHYGFVILGYLLWRFHIIVDMADGTVARATKCFSRAADGFDRSIHIVVNTSLLFAVNDALVSPVIICLLVITFYLNYFFTRNYYLGKAKTYPLPLWKIISKNIIGLEGYILFSLILTISHQESFQQFLTLIYAFFFLLIYFVKLRAFLADEVKHEG